jgi:hypothetical protein
VNVAIAESCTIFLGLIIVVSFLRERLSPALGRSPDLQVTASGLPPAVLG